MSLIDGEVLVIQAIHVVVRPHRALKNHQKKAARQFNHSSHELV
jgi:hypothetical protein